VKETRVKKIFGETLVFRLTALIVLVICLVLVSDGGAPQRQASPEPVLQQPKITAETQPDSPLAISSIQSSGQMPPDSHSLEFGFYVVNASSKPIAAFAIKQEVIVAGAKSGGGVSLYHPLLANSPLLGGRSLFISDTSGESLSKNTVITLSIDFVQFADNTKWGPDSAQSSERVQGQRAAAELVSQYLLETLNRGEDVLRAIEKGVPDIPYPQDQTETWKAGFNSGLSMLVDRLKKDNEKGGIKEIERELLRLNETFKRKV
jgi:hypothetical protein